MYMYLMYGDEEAGLMDERGRDRGLSRDDIEVNVIAGLHIKWQSKFEMIVCRTYCCCVILFVTEGEGVGMLLESVVSEAERVLVALGLTSCVGISRTDGIGEF